MMSYFDDGDVPTGNQTRLGNPGSHGIFQQVAEGIHSAKDLEKIQGRKIVFRPFY